MRLIPSLLALAAIAGAAGWWLTAPTRVPAAALSDLSGDATHGELVFWATGCASCHMAPGAKGEAQLVLAGGQAFPTAFGTFHAPNISPSAEGIGGWTTEEFVTAVTKGVSPGGQHYYPAFPYTSYQRMSAEDLHDLPAAELLHAGPAHRCFLPGRVNAGRTQPADRPVALAVCTLPDDSPQQRTRVTACRDPPP